MKRFLILITLCIVLSNCVDIEVKEPKIVAIDDGQPVPSPPPPPIDPAIVQGAWTDGSTENATFSINNDEIQYVDQLQSFPYTFRSDSIEIKYEGYTYKARVSLLNDTLTMTDENGETRFWRFKN